MGWLPVAQTPGVSGWRRELQDETILAPATRHPSLHPEPSEPCSATCQPSRCTRSPARVRIVISVDWEGRDLAAANRRAFAAFPRAHPDVPLTHFLNAA